MRRVWLMIASASLITAIGCGKENYDKRMEKSLEKMKYDQRIKKNLMPEPKDDKKFTDLAIYVRPPKEEVAAKTGELPVGEGQFDLDASFYDNTDSKLHVLARVKRAKKPPAKGAPPAPAPTARGGFDGDVLTVVSSVFGSPDALLTPKFVEEQTKRGNRFKRLIFSAGEAEVKIYIYKKDNYEVALIFVYNTKLKGPISTKIDMCLDTFATGQTATNLYNGGHHDDEAESGPAGPV